MYTVTAHYHCRSIAGYFGRSVSLTDVGLPSSTSVTFTTG